MFSQEDLDLLKGSQNLLPEIEKQRKLLKEKYQVLVDKTPIGPVTYEQFAKSFILCQSRSLSFKYNGAFENLYNGGKTTALVPIVDMANH